MGTAMSLKFLSLVVACAPCAAQNVTTTVGPIVTELGTTTIIMPAPGTGKDKIMLLMMQIIPLYLCGIDRCYMGSYCTGILKGLTAGGFGIWSILDQLAIIPNAIQESPTIDSLAIEGTFEPISVEGAKNVGYIAIVGLMLNFVILGRSVDNGVKTAMERFKAGRRPYTSNRELDSGSEE